MFGQRKRRKTGKAQCGSIPDGKGNKHRLNRNGRCIVKQRDGAGKAIVSETGRTQYRYVPHAMKVS